MLADASESRLQDGELQEDALQENKLQDRLNEQATDYSIYEHTKLRSHYISKVSDNENKATLFISNLKCQSCSRHIDTLLRTLEGITDVQVNVVNKCVTVYWHQQQTLSNLLSFLEKSGYPAQPMQGYSKVNTEQEYKLTLKRLAVAGFGMMQVMTYAIGLYAGELQGMEDNIHRFLTMISLLIATGVIFYSGAPFFKNAFNDLSQHRLGMDVPIALAMGGAYCASVYSVLLGEGHVIYFDSVVMFIFFLSISRTIEMLVRHRSIHTHEALLNLMPPFVTVERQGETMTIPCEHLNYGDRVVIHHNDIVPADGVSDSEARLDESWLTGESRILQKTSSQTILAGSRNKGDSFVLKVTHFGQQTALAQIENLLHKAQRSRPRIEILANKVAAYFVSSVLILSLLAGVIWWFIDAQRVFDVVLAVLVVTCPCALSLAMPTSLLAASQYLSRQGILLTCKDSLEKLCKAQHWIFDKTGTLTMGQMRVVKTQSLNKDYDQTQCLNIAAALEATTQHSIADAFKEYSGVYHAEDCHVQSGAGVEGRIDTITYRLGKPSWIKDWCCDQQCESLQLDLNVTQVMLATPTQLLAVFYIADELRHDAKWMIQQLQKGNTSYSLLSGDNASVVTQVAEQLGITDYVADCLPEKKLHYLEQLRKNNPDKMMIMVGDGINDAPVLAAADVAISFGSGSELAQSTSDVIIIGERLDALDKLKKTAKRSLHIGHQNISWAILYNVTALPLAFSGYLSPWMAALGMSLSSLLVVLNAMRVSKIKEPTDSKKQVALFE